MKFNKAAFVQFLAGVAFFLCSTQIQCQSLTQSVDWEVLHPEMASEVDPFADMPTDQITAMIQLVRLDTTIASGQRADSKQLRALRRQIADKLKEQGVAVEDLLAKRLQIIDQRRAQAETMTAELAGKSIQIEGYLLPLQNMGMEKTGDYLLVPWRGACSHTPPPPMNQVIRLDAVQLPDKLDFQKPVQVSGSLNIKPQMQEFHLVDGFLSVASGYAMQKPSVNVAQ